MTTESLHQMLDRQTMIAAVARAITCIVTGQVLDVRTAVFVYRNDAADASIIAAVSPDGWAEREDTLRSRFPNLVARKYE